jgi:hypothetical protein
MILMLLMVVEIGVATAIGFILGRIWQIRSDLEQQHAGDFRAPRPHSASLIFLPSKVRLEAEPSGPRLADFDEAHRARTERVM